jgi:DNA-directed RNA polymerase subunit E'/Rpb7
MAIACLPLRDEVLDGRVIEVMATGITVQSGPIKTFISLKVSQLARALQNKQPKRVSNHLLLLVNRKTALTTSTTSSRTPGSNGRK